MLKFKEQYVYRQDHTKYWESHYIPEWISDSCTEDDVFVNGSDRPIIGPSNASRAEIFEDINNPDWLWYIRTWVEEYKVPSSFYFVHAPFKDYYGRWCNNYNWTLKDRPYEIYGYVSEDGYSYIHLDDAGTWYMFNVPTPQLFAWVERSLDTNATEEDISAIYDEMYEAWEQDQQNPYDDEPEDEEHIA